MTYSFDDIAEVMGRSVDAASKELGVSGSTLQQYRQGMSEKVADRLACKAGFHPSLIWPHWGQEALEKARQQDEARMVTCALDGCETTFVPSTSRQVFCAPPCRWRATVIRRRATPEGREYAAAKSREYLADPRARAYKNAQRRRHYRENRDRELARQREYDQQRRAS